jgi:hypothetical protein
MMNSIKKYDVYHIIDTVMDLLDRDTIQQKIELPIIEAAATFKYKAAQGFSCKEFIKTAGKFIQHIYQNGLGIQQELSPHQAEAEAIYILEMRYQNTCSKGYYAAVLDSQNPNLDGLKCVLNQIINIIIQNRRNDYVHWVFTTNIQSLDWRTKCKIAKTLQRQWSSILPSDIKNYPPAMLADNIPKLIDVCIAADNTITILSSTDIAPDFF